MGKVSEPHVFPKISYVVSIRISKLVSPNIVSTSLRPCLQVDIFCRETGWCRVRVTCISSSGVVIGEENPTTGVDENDMSIALLITYGNFRYFMGGDIERETEGDIAERDLVMDVDMYQADHHGR